MQQCLSKYDTYWFKQSRNFSEWYINIVIPGLIQAYEIRVFRAAQWQNLYLIIYIYI